MAKTEPILNSFVAGELSPKLAGRSDIQQYYQSAAEIRNMLVEFYGGAKKAPGTYFVAEAKDSGAEATPTTNLVPFIFSDEQAYMLESGEKYIRFYKPTGAVLETHKDFTGTGIVVATGVITAASHGFSDGDTVFIDNIVGTTELNGRRFKVDNATTHTFTLTDIDDVAIDTTGYTPYDSGGEVSRVYTLTSGVNYTVADIFELQFAQTADILYITLGSSADAAKGRPQSKLTRTGDTSWTLTPIDYSVDPARPALMPTNIITASTIDASADSGDGITLTATEDIFDILHEGSIWRIKDGYVLINTVDNENFVSDADVLYDISLNTGGTGNPTADWAEGAWSDYRGYPKSVAISEDRLIYGYTVSQPQTTWGSVIGAYDTFELGADDADAISFKADTSKVEVINWLFPSNEILVGTPSGVSSLGTGSETLALAATTGRMKKKSSYGTSDIIPAAIGNNIFYWQKFNRVLREYFYTLSEDNYKADDATALSEHITESGIIDMAYQQSPFSILWCVRADGKLAAFTRQIEQKVSAWTLHDTQGFYESVAVIPGESYDQVWFVVRRTIGGVCRRYIEYMTAPDFEDLEDMFFVHSGLTLDDPKDITNATAADPVVITCDNDFDNGDIVKIRGLVEREAGKIPEKTIDFMEYATDALAQAAYVTNGAFDSYTKLLAHFDIVKATSVLAETGQTITYVGTADCQTTTKKWTGSLLLDGNSDYVTVPDSTDWDYGSDPFTIEFWWRPAEITTANFHQFYGQCGTVQCLFHWIGSTTNKIRFYNYDSGFVVYFTCPFTPTIDTWYHIALVRVNTDNAATGWRIFIDGVPQTLTLEGGAWNAALSASAAALTIGYDTSTAYLNGYLDEFRVSKGIARWTADFSASLPTAPYDKVLQSYSEPTLKTQGLYSLKIIALATNSLGKTLTRTIATSLNLTDADTISLDIRASRLGSNIKIDFYNSGVLSITHTPDILIAGTFQTESIDISAIANTDKDDIDSIVITILDADADNTFYIDNIYTEEVPAETVGMTELNNNKYIVADAHSTYFHLHDLDGNNVDGTDFTPYDTGGEVRKCVDSVSGLQHLAGMIVQVLTDGAYHPDRLVSDAGVITLDSYYGIITVGLGYTARLKTNDLEGAPGGVSSQGKTKRVLAIRAKLYKSLDFSTGTDDKMDDISVRPLSLGVLEATPLYTGIKPVPFPSGWDTKKQVVIEQDKCLALHILSLIADMEIN